VKTHHYAVIFSSSLIDLDDSKYHGFSKEMLERVAAASGFLGVESYREKDGKGVTISYWKPFLIFRNGSKMPDTFSLKNTVEKKPIVLIR